MTSRRFTFQEGNSNKFWEIELTGSSFNVRYGRIDSDGQTQTKTFANAADAQKQYDKLVAEKVKKGYVAELPNSSSAKAGSKAKSKTSKQNVAPKKTAPQNVKGSAKSPQTNKVASGQIALDKLAEAVARTDAKAIVKMFEGVSEAERARVRAALLEIHGMFGWNENAIKPAASKKYTPAERKNGCAEIFKYFVPIAVGGPRDDLAYATHLSSRHWKEEVHQILRGRPLEWLIKQISQSSNVGEWIELMNAGVLPQVLDDRAVRILLEGFYQDDSATELKSVFKSFPWISDIVYRVYSFENWVVNSSNFAERLSCLSAFIEFLADKNILDRNKLVGCVLDGIHQVPKAKHVGGCVLILEHLEPTVEESIVNQGALCTALAMGTPNGQDYLIKQMERCCLEKKFDAASASSAIATILPQVTIMAAKQAFRTLVAMGQNSSCRTAVLSALVQSLLHTKREIAELGLRTLRTNFSNQDQDTIHGVKAVLSHCSQVIKKQVNEWLAGPPELPSGHQPPKAAKSKASTEPKRAPSESLKDVQKGKPARRNPELIKTFRDFVPSLAASPLVESHLTLCNFYNNKRISSPDLFTRLITTHFGLPYIQDATEILGKLKSNFDEINGSKESSWWEAWSNSLTAAVVLGDANQAQKIADWFNFVRRETSYDFQKPSPGICYLTVLLANQLRTKKIEPNKTMQSAMTRDKNAKGWLSVYQALEANNEAEFLKVFTKATQTHIRQFEADVKAGKSYRTAPVTEIGTLLWHAGKQQGFDVNRLGKETMAVVMTRDSLVPSGKPDPSDHLQLPVAKDRITQSLKSLVKLFDDCEIKYAMTTSYIKDKDDELKIYRWQLVADVSAESFERLYQAHDPFQFSLNRQIFDSKRNYEAPLLIDLKNGVVLDHVQLSKAAMEEALSKSQPTKQHGVMVQTCCIEHIAALACPVVDRLRKGLGSSTGKLQNRLIDCRHCADYSKRVIKMTEDNKFNWKIAEQLASRITSAKGALAAIQRGEKVPPRFNSLLKMANE